VSGTFFVSVSQLFSNESNREFPKKYGLLIIFRPFLLVFWFLDYDLFPQIRVDFINKLRSKNSATK